MTKLDTEGFEARHIMAVSSHKSEQSIKSYAAKCPENKRKEMFDALAQPFQDPLVPLQQIQDNIQGANEQIAPPHSK